MDGPEGRTDRPAAPGRVHEVTVRNREAAEVTGVLHVASFDDRTIVLDTELGLLTMSGQDLQIKRLDLAEGRFSVEGVITSVEWSEARQRPDERGRGILSRLLR
ncbi:MAG: sporulation protein YabP [Clostridia bacterium]|nr:sporulation protein YabP [Clostridia bacterium]